MRASRETSPGRMRLPFLFYPRSRFSVRPPQMSTARGIGAPDSLHWPPAHPQGLDLASDAPRPAKLFVSYTSADRELIVPLVEFLKSQDWEVWWDRHIEAGETFDRRIERELASADCIVVVWSRTSVTSKWVLSEAMAAFESNRLVPVALDTKLAIPLPFNRVHTASLVDWTGMANHPGLTEVAAGIRATLQTLGMRSAQPRESMALHKPVVAVLPFDDLDAPATPRPLCSIISTRLITALGRFSALETVSRRASF